MFKNFILYSLTDKLDLSDIETRLNSFRSKEPSRTAIESVGFMPPFPTSEDLSYELLNSHYFCLRFFKKNIPAKLVNYQLGQKLANAKEKGREINKKLKQELKEEIINRIASETPAVPDTVRFMYDKDNDILCVDSSSHKKAESCIALLRKAINSVPCKPLIDFNLGFLLTSWCFDGNLPNELTIQNKVKLKAHDDTKSEASFNYQEVDAEEVVAARDSGKLITQVSLLFDNDFTFVFSDDGTVKSIKYTDFKIEDFSDIPKANEAELFDAEMALNTDSVRKFVEFANKNIGQKN